MFCSHCGAQIADNVQYCPSCGAAAGARAAPGAQQPQPPPPPPYAQPLQPADVSPSSRLVAILLCFFVGGLGIHRFYVGKIGTGLLQLCTFGGLGIWWLYDWILVIAGGFRDVEGRRVANWAEGESSGRGGEISQEKLEILLDEIDSLRGEMGDLAERMDFMERMLTSARDRGAIPPGPGTI